MTISHKSVFVLVKTVEVDVALADESQGRWTSRVELFQDAENLNHFRCHVWELELFRLTPTLPMDENDQPAEISDDVLMVERPLAQGKLNYSSFVAANVDVALEMVLEDLKLGLEHTTIDGIF